MAPKPRKATASDETEAANASAAPRARKTRAAPAAIPATAIPDAPQKVAKTAQEKSRAAVLAQAKRLMTARPNDHLVSILADLREINIGRRDPGKFHRTKDIGKPIGAAVMAEAGLDPDDTFSHPDVAGGAYRIGTVSPTRYLAQLLRPNTTAVMELGSAWSANLFQLYLAHGATRSKKINYYGGEHTREGMICAKYIAARDPLMNYRSFHFDYATPNVTFLERQKGHILLFTSHAIEQVDVINPELFEQLRAIPNPVTVVHFEPVGWQRIPELLARRDAQDSAFFEDLGTRAEAGSTASVTENAAWWSWRQKYNQNLLPLLQRLEDQGAIRMARRAYDFSGSANVLNPTSLLHYDFVR